MQSILNLVRIFLREDLLNRQLRFEYVNFFIGALPANFGFKVRQMIIPRFFYSAGQNIKIHPGIRYRAVQKINCGSNVRLGADNFYNAGGGLTIGDNAILGPGVKIWTANHRYDSAETPISDQGMVYRSVSIGEDVWLGSNAFVMPGTELGPGCIVAAGAIVNAKKYPPYSILAGNPARVIGNRQKQVQSQNSE